MLRNPVTVAGRAAVAWRRLVARRPWVHWLAVAVLAGGTASAVAARLDDVDATRRAWGDTARVAVAARPHEPGAPLVVHVAEVPVALVPDAAIRPPGTAALVARQRIAEGEIVTAPDVTGAGPLALVPEGWLAVPVVESPPSGAAVGDRVAIVSEGVVLTGEAVVVDVRDDVTLIAVPAEAAPAVPAAAAAGALAVLRAP